MGLGIDKEPGEDFLRFVIGDDDTGAQDVAAAQEWWGRTRDEEAAIDKCMSWISVVSPTRSTVAGRLQIDRQNVKKTVNSTLNDRLWNLDVYDNDLSQQLLTYKEYVSGINDLERTYALMAPPGSFLLRGIRYLQKTAKAGQKDLEDEAAKIRETVHSLKRRSPGRKAPRKHTRGEFDRMKRQAYEQQRSMPGPALRHPCTPIHPDVVKWHHIILDNTGCQNEGTEVCLGVAWDGRIVDRRVQKIVHHEGENWGSPHKWWYFQNDELYPMEYVTQTTVGQSAEARFALQTTSEPVLQTDRQMFHLYLEFAPCGDLEKVIDAHIETGHPIPETFIMLVFQSLIETAMIMKKNFTHPKARAPSNWLEIVHKDLKPANIFLTLPNENHFPCFPTPKLADYGLATLTHKDDPLNPSFYNTVGTSGYDAPEQSSMYDPVTNKPVDNFPILSPCNIWAIGAVMYTMMTLNDLSLYEVEALPYYVNAGKEKAKGDEFERNLDDDLRKRWGHLRTYNAALRHAVQSCMNFLPEARPAVEELKEWIDTEMRDNEGFKNASRGWAFEGGLCWEQEREEWKLGMCWPPKVGLGLGRGRR